MPKPTPVAAGLAALLAEYDEWRANRAELSERENDYRNLPDSDEWAASDDAAADLLRRLAEGVRRTQS